MRRGLTNVENGFSFEVVRLDLVTHGRAPVGWVRPLFRLCIDETAVPTKEPVWGRLLEADSPLLESMETDRVASLLSYACASEPPVKVD
jgi:hypothetical protein